MIIFFSLLMPFVYSLPIYHQNDYEVIPEIVKVEWFEPKYYKYAEAGLGWYNRSTRVINAKLYSIVENPVNNTTIIVQAYKFLSNEYRFFPLTFELDTCKEYYHNNFGVRRMLNETSNIRGCPLQMGSYYIRNAVLDFSHFPPYIPRGQYKMVLNLTYIGKTIGSLAAFVRIVDNRNKGFLWH